MAVLIMDSSLQQKIERIVGTINTVAILDEQGCTSEVSRINTVKGSYILKSAFKDRYRKWLMAEAKVLENFGQEKLTPIPKFFCFFDEKDSSHLIMSLEPGTTLTAALRNAESSFEKLKLIRSFGQFLVFCKRKFLTIANYFSPPGVGNF